MGFLVTQGGRCDVQLQFANGTSKQYVKGFYTLTAGSTYFFDYTFTPGAGTKGAGLITINLYDSGHNRIATGAGNLTASDLALGASFDSFGLNTTPQTPRPPAT